MIPGPDEEPEAPLEITPGFAAVLAIGAGFLQGFVYLLIAPEQGPVAPERLGIAAIVGYGVAFALGAARLPPPPGPALGFVAAPARAWAAALFLFPSLLLVSEFDNLFRGVFPPPVIEDAAGTPAELGSLLGWAAFAIAVRPMVEEIFFRGLLQPRLVSHWGARNGVLASAALAGLTSSIWLNPWAFGLVFAAALVLGLLRQSAGSLLPGLLLNSAFGLTGFLSLQGAFGIPGFDDLSADHTPLGWLLLAALPTGVGLGLCRSLRARATPT